MKSVIAIAALTAVAALAIGQELDILEPFPGLEVLPPSEASRHVSVSAVASHLEVAPGGSFHVAADVRIEEGWVYYSADPGQRVLAARIEVSAAGLRAAEVLWPADHVHEVVAGRMRLVNNVYEGRAIAFVPVTVPPQAPAGEYRVGLTLKGQICKDVCLTLADDVAAGATVRVGAASVANPAWQEEPAFSAELSRARTAARIKADRAAVEVAGEGPAAEPITVWSALGLALLAGLILNVMPCVLPVVPLRILSVVQMAGGSRRRFVTLGLAFAGGILLFFLAVASANAALKLGMGRAMNWSEHYQNPAVRVALAMIVVSLAANLFGLFTIVVPRRLAGAAEASQGAGGHLAGAGMGLMLAVMATPCSFAILTGTLAWAQLQPLWLGSTALVLIGIGMAAPHALLCAVPRLVDVLPRPGRWMELLKQTMGFLLLLAAAYLISTVDRPMRVAGFAVVLAMCLWAWGSWVRFDAAIGRKLLVRLPAAAVAVAAGWWLLRAPAPPAVRFEAFDAARIAAARADGKPVLVKFTASWCTSCKWLELTVYDDAEVARELEAKGVLAMEADVTDQASPASRFLSDTFNKPVPLTALYPPSRAGPVLLAGTFDKRDLLDALDRMGP